MAKKIGIFLFCFVIFVFPNLAFSGSYKLDSKEVHYQGLVPCGKSFPVGEEDVEVTMPCQFCHLFVMLKGVIDYIMFPFVPLIAAFFFALGGFMFLFGAENPGWIKKGKETMVSVLIGLFIVYSAWLVINLFFMVIGVADWTGLKEGWFTIHCPIASPSPP